MYWCIISCNTESCLVAIFIPFNFLSDAGLGFAMMSVYTPTSLLVLLSESDKGLLGILSGTCSPTESSFQSHQKPLTQ